MTLLETLVAVTVLATGVLALQRLATDGVAGIADAGARTRAMLVAQQVLAEATLAPPEPGRTVGTAGAMRFTREVRPTAHPGLREVAVRVESCELVELIRVPTS